MKQLLMTIATLLLVCMGAKAQDEAMAVLTHGTTTKTFSGRQALITAYAEATHGDLITLSSGRFESVDTIEKAITIRGAGLGNDETYHTQATVIYNDMTLAIPDDVAEKHFQMEGIFHDSWIYYANNLQNAKFSKCRLGFISAGQYGDNLWGTCQNLQFFHCKITGALVCNSNSTMTLMNSYVEAPVTHDSNTSIISFRNCVIKPVYKEYSALGVNKYAYKKVDDSDDGVAALLYSCYLTNSIICMVNDSDPIYWNDNTVFTNCLLPSSLIPSADRNTYQNYTLLTSIFKTFSGTYGELETFALKNTTAYLGNDGKQVGMYGGVIPYTPRLTGPHIKTLQVSDHSTSDGKLNVKIQIENTTD